MPRLCPAATCFSETSVWIIAILRMTAKPAHWIMWGAGLLAILLATTVAEARETTPGVAGLVVRDDGRTRIAGAMVWINGHSIQTNRQGRFSRNGLPDKVIELRVERGGFYPARHIFSVTELQLVQGHFLVPAIPLVARVPGRTLFVFGGDVMLGRRFEAPAFGEAPVVRANHRLEDIKRLLTPISWDLANADYASVNLETVVSRSPRDTPPPKSVTFYSPPELVDALKWAGVDYVTLGNNHSYDYLQGGIADTLTELDRVALPWSGAGRNEPEAMKPYVVKLNGTGFALHGFVGWKGTVTPHQAAEGEKGGAALASEQTISAALDADVAARRSAIVQFHDGTEYSDVPTDRVKQNMELALTHGAALVIGHHPHVTQGFALVDGRLVAYSIGNLLFDQDFYETQASMLLKVWMDGQQFYRAEIVPLHIRNYQPAPALGSIRVGLLERLTRLSSVNGVSIAQIAGHGVIWPRASDHRPWPVPGLRSHGTANGEFANDLWLRGDFESVFAGTDPERSWQVEGGKQALQWTGPNSGFALSIQSEQPDQPLVVTQKTFMRSYSAGNLTLSARVKPGCQSTLVAQVQFRGERKPGEAAPLNSEWITAGNQPLAPDAWSTLSFTLPRGSDFGKGFRVRLARETQLQCDKPLLLDDIRILQGK